MTNDTNYRGKANAVFFAAIMVVSMFAAGFAAAPAAAVTNGSATATDTTTIGQSTGADFSFDVQSSDSSVENDVAAAVSIASDGADLSGVSASDVTVNLNGNDITGTSQVDSIAINQLSGANEFAVVFQDSTPSPTNLSLAADDTLQVSVANTAITNNDVSGDYDVDFGLHGQDGSGNVITGSTLDSLSVSDGYTVTPATVSGTVNNADGDAVEGATVEVNSATQFNDTTDANGDYSFDITDASALTLGGFQVDASATGYNTENVGSVDATSGSDTVDFTSSGAGAALTFNVGAQFLVDGSSQNIYYTGQEINVTGLAANADYELRSAESFDTSSGAAEGSSFEDEFSTDDTGSFTFDSEGSDSSFYYITGPGVSGSAEDNSFELTTQNLDATFDEDSVQADESVDLEFDSNRGTYAVNVSADGDLDDDELSNIFDDEFSVNSESVGDEDDEEIQITGVNDGTFSTNFTDTPTGDYTFTFDVPDTTAEDTDSINVTESGEGDVQFTESTYSTPQGDVVNVTLELDETTTGSLIVGDQQDDNYQANISVTDDNDDGQVSVLFNTYSAGQRGTLAEVANSDDEITVHGESGSLSNLLDTGDYTMSASPTQITSNDGSSALNDESDVASLVINDRSTEEMVLWRTTSDVRDDVVEARDDDGDDAAVEEITTGVDDGVVTETDEVALGNPSDVLVHQLSVTGLEGILEDNGGTSSDELYDVLSAQSSANNLPSDDRAARLVFEEQNPGSNVEPNDINAYTDLSRSEFNAAVDVVYDDANGDYYLFLDLDELNSALGDEIEDGDEYTAEFTVQDTLFTEAAQDDNTEDVEDAFESVSANFDAATADGDFSSDPVEVANAEGETIEGTLNVAPGTELTVRARSDDDSSTNFIKNSEEVVVQPDGTFSGEFDFSEQEVNDTFTASTQQSPLTEELSVDGTVVEATDDATATFEVSELDPTEATATAGDSVDVSATIENTGDAEGTQTVAFTLDGDELDTTEVTLESGGSQTVEFSADTSGLEAGDYTHGVATDDDEATGTLTIEAAGDDSSGDDSSGDDSSGDDSSGDDSSGDDSSGDGNGTDDSTDDGTPGFGALVALVALIAAALLATRRNE